MSLSKISNITIVPSISSRVPSVFNSLLIPNSHALGSACLKLSILPIHPLAESLPITFMPPMAMYCFTVEATMRSTCSHNPFSLCRWRVLKPIIGLFGGVFYHELFGTLLKRVALMYSGLIQSGFGTTIPQSGIHTCTTFFFFFRREG